jgi:hypothetical protein
MVVAIFGTTISPYLFFWQASQEAEESRLSHRSKHSARPAGGADAFKQIAVDTWVGMFVSNCIAFFIIVTTAATLPAHGITKIETAAQAAEALRPIAGELTFVLFAAGIIGTGLLAVPILDPRPMPSLSPSVSAGALSFPRVALSVSMRSSAQQLSEARRSRRPTSIRLPCCSGPPYSTASFRSRSWRR